MNYTEQPLLVITVGDNRTIVLPDSIPSGATIGIVVLSKAPKRKLTRKERCQREPISLPSDIALNALIERTRKELVWHNYQKTKTSVTVSV